MSFYKYENNVISLPKFDPAYGLGIYNIFFHSNYIFVFKLAFENKIHKTKKKIEKLHHRMDKLHHENDELEQKFPIFDEKLHKAHERIHKWEHKLEKASRRRGLRAFIADEVHHLLHYKIEHIENCLFESHFFCIIL